MKHSHTKNLQEQFFINIQIGEYKEVRRVINKVDINKHYAGGTTALHCAALSSDLNCLNLLLSQRGLNLNPRNVTGSTPLHQVSRAGRLEAAKQLVKAKADVNVCDRLFESPLHKAVAEGHNLIIEFLLASGANPNGYKGSSHAPIHLAAVNCNLSALSSLIAYGADTRASIPGSVAGSVWNARRLFTAYYPDKVALFNEAEKQGKQLRKAKLGKDKEQLADKADKNSRPIFKCDNLTQLITEYLYGVRSHSVKQRQFVQKLLEQSAFGSGR